MAKRPRTVTKAETLITCFGFCPIVDQELLGKNEIGVLLVKNREEIRFQGRKGKPEGFGMPGGGADDRLCHPEKAVEGEINDEAGLKVLEVQPLFIEPKTIFLGRDGGLLRQFYSFTPGHESIRYIPGKEHPLHNPIHVFFAKVDWAKSALRKLLLKIKAEREKKGMDTTDGTTVDFEDLTKEELASLNITEQDRENPASERNEIIGIGVIKLGVIGEYLLACEDAQERYRRAVELAEATGKEITIAAPGRPEIYYSHMKFIEKACAMCDTFGIQIG